MPGKLPNFIIGGVVKGGTTSLFTYLSQHPEFCPSDIKETSFFKVFYQPEEGTPDSVDLDKYKAHFAHHRGQAYVFEASPGYIGGGERLARFLKEKLPGLRVAMILRDPADRCRSVFEFQKGMLRLDDAMGLDAYIDACRAHEAAGRLDERAFRAYRGLRDGRYAEKLEGWLSVFGPDELAILFFDDLKADAAGFTDRVCAWLGAAPASAAGVDFSAVNVSARPSNRGAHRIALMANAAFEGLFRRNPGLKKRLRALYFRVNRPQKADRPGGGQLARLRDEFAEPNRRLRTLLEARRPDLALPRWLLDA